jgi:hypothetical protein
MRRSLLSEQKLVVVLFILVLITFVFAQADSAEMENMHLRDIPAISTSLDKPSTPDPKMEIPSVLPAVEFR